MAPEQIVDLATRETEDGWEVTARLVRLVDWTGRGEWQREWRVGDEWSSCPIPDATALDSRPRDSAARPARGIAGRGTM